jgi:hypothetical protein
MFEILSPVQWGIVAAAIAAVAGIYVPWGKISLPSFGAAKADSPHAALDHLAAIQQYIFNHGRGPSRTAALTKCADLAHAIIDSGFIGGPSSEDDS